jgi:hypothetical protein
VFSFVLEIERVFEDDFVLIELPQGQDISFQEGAAKCDVKEPLGI